MNVKHSFRVSVFACLSSLAMTAGRGEEQRLTIDLRTWSPPQIAALAADDPFAQAVRYGHALFTNTANEIGPNVQDPHKRLAGNNLSCQSCHLEAGRRPHAMPLVGVWGQFPQYRAREGKVASLEDRINGCMERSLNGRALPIDSPEMIALSAYARWLSTGIPDGATLIAARVLPIKEPGRPADPARGAAVYAEACASCHGQDGRGQPAPTGPGYHYPPLWGSDSYNNGAGMNRVLTAAAFILHNMPVGVSPDAPVLTDADAYDVSAYINSQERPQMADLELDFPKRLEKPVDTPYGPFGDGFSLKQHKFGPFSAIRAKIHELTAASVAAKGN